MKLERPRNGRMVAGVCAGIAKYLNMDVNLVRLVTAVVMCLGAGWVLYPLLWAVMPEEGSTTTGLDTFVGQMKDWQAQRVSRPQNSAPSGVPTNAPVFDPYDETPRSGETH